MAAPPALAPPLPSSSPADGSAYSLGFSNAFGIGNGFREEHSTAIAEANISNVKPSTDPPGGHDLSAAAADSRPDPEATERDHLQPQQPDGYQDALDEAQTAGITTVAIDGYVTDPETWNISNDQFNYGYIGASWLFEKLGGTGNVYYMRGIVGHPADLDRHAGVMQALEENPGITLLPSNDGVDTGWNQDTGTKLITDRINDGSYDTFDGIWTSASTTSSSTQSRPRQAVRPDRWRRPEGFVDQLLHKDPKYDGLEGIAVYNPAAIGGAGVKLALQVLSGQTPTTTTLQRTTADGVQHDVKVVLLPEPEAYPNDTPEGMQTVGNRHREPERPLAGQLVHKRLDRLHARPGSAATGLRARKPVASHNPEI